MRDVHCILAFLTFFVSAAQVASHPFQVEKDSIEKLGTENHARMLQQLGIQALRPGASGDESAPNHANYNESVANPCPILPDALLTTNGRKVTDADTWWNIRRPELLELFEKEVYGRVPDSVPEVTWKVEVTDYEFVRRIPVIARKLVGHVDNSSHPQINVDINMILVVPANVKGPAPVLMMFGRPAFPNPAQPSPEEMRTLNEAFKEMLIRQDPELKALFEKYPAFNPVIRSSPTEFFGAQPEGDLPSTEQLLSAGWGYATIEPLSIQADNSAGLRSGIIGLVNQGKPRKPDEWGALRAWAWGAGRGLDYLETDELVDAKKVGIEGVSRFGKAALVTLAFDTRFALGLIGSSGKGGTTLHRRVFGEAVENLTGSGESHWMAGNYMKYGAQKADFGRKTACDLPVDSHELIALCAPRPAFISYGIPEKGDARWLDQKGSYMATIAAGEVYKLLGARDLGVTNNYMREVMPPHNTDMLDGHLAWRQHDGGHTDWPNMKYFIPWANQLLGYEKKASD